jgi:hypothetical protein
MTINVAIADLKYPFKAGSDIYDQPNIRYGSVWIHNDIN